MLRAFLFVFCLVFAGILAAPASFGQSGATAPPGRENTLSSLSTDELIDRLAASPDKSIAEPLEAEVLRRFHESGSPTVDLLLSWATAALQNDENIVALDLLDQIVLLEPEFAEGWNKRATVHFLMKEYGKSLADIRQTLAREPRHFGALAGLGLILREIGKPTLALEAARAALAVHPYLENAVKLAEELESEVGGDSI